MELSRWALVGGPALLILTWLAWLLRAPLVYLAVLLLALASIAGWVWGRFGLIRVEYRRRVIPDRCFAGEPMVLEMELTNRKALPVMNLAVDDELPEALQLQERRLFVAGSKRASLRHLFTAGWYMRVRRRYTLVASRRGLFQIGPALISGGDPFGMREARLEIPEQVQVLVFPQVKPLPAVGLPSRRPFGDLKSSDRLFPDPLRTAGVRDYQPGDPLNRMHWKATAAGGRLQVKDLEPSAQGGLAAFLNLWGFTHRWEGYDPEALERGVEVAAAAAGWAVEHGVPAGLYANGLAQGWMHTLRLPVARGPQVLPRILEGLARLAPPSQQPLSQLLGDELPGLGYGTALLIITPAVAPDLAELLLRARHRGHPVTVMVTGAGVTAPSLRGIRVFAYQNSAAPDLAGVAAAAGGGRP